MFHWQVCVPHIKLFVTEPALEFGDFVELGLKLVLESQVLLLQVFVFKGKSSVGPILVGHEPVHVLLKSWYFGICFRWVELELLLQVGIFVLEMAVLVLEAVVGGFWGVKLVRISSDPQAWVHRSFIFTTKVILHKKPQIMIDSRLYDWIRRWITIWFIKMVII